MYQLKDGSYINANKVTHFIELQETRTSDKKYIIIISDGTKQYVCKEDYDALMEASGTATYSDLVVTDKLTVGDIDDVEQAINNIEDFSDVKDVVACYDNTSDPSVEGKTDIVHYDTSKLNDLDIVEVLDDESQDHTNTMYKWHKDSETWELIGSLGPYYTKNETDTKYVSSVEYQPSEEGGSGKLVYVKGNGGSEDIIELEVLRDLLLTPDPDTPDVGDTELTDSEMTLIVTDENGNSVKMTLEELRQRFAASTDVDNADFDSAQVGAFLYEEMTDIETLAEWADINNQNAWEAEYANPNSALNKYYAWSDDANKPYKEDLWNTVEQRPAQLRDARKNEQGEYVYDDNGNYIYDNCERCWLGAINAPGASYPWAVVELPIPFYGTIKFTYKDEKVVYPWGEEYRTFGRGFGVASIPDELNMPELKINVAGEATVPLLEGDLVITVIEGGE